MAIIADIVAELERGGPLKNPFARGYPSTAPTDYVRIEVQRSIERVRGLQTSERREQAARNFIEQLADSIADRDTLKRLSEPPPSLADIRKAAKAFRKVKSLFINDDQMIPKKLEMFAAGRQEPPPRADAMKFQCAAEAFCLMEWFSAKEATFSEGGPFQIIAEKLYEAVTGKSDANLERACDWVLTKRRKVR